MAGDLHCFAERPRLGVARASAARAAGRDAWGWAYRVRRIDGRFVAPAVRREFGLSLRQGRPMSNLLKERLPTALELAFPAGLLALVLGIPLGVSTALKRTLWFSQVPLTVSLIGVSLPTFLIGILLILIFAVILGWLPSFGCGETAALVGGRRASSPKAD